MSIVNNEFPFLKNNFQKGREDWGSVEWLEEFKSFLMGEGNPKGMTITKTDQPRLSNKKAVAIIWYLQEHLSVFPDTIESCDVCGRLFDCNSEGLYWETKSKHYCGSCDYLVPQNYDRGRK